MLTRHRRTSMFVLRLGSSDEMQGSLQFFVLGLLSPIFFGRFWGPGAVLGCHQAPKTMILKAWCLHFGHLGSILVIQGCTGVSWVSNGHLEAQNSIFIGLRVHSRRLLGSTSGSLVVLLALWETFLCPWTQNREARRVQKAISGQPQSSYICMCFAAFSEVTDHKWPIWGRTLAHGEHFWPHGGAIGATFSDCWSQHDLELSNMT